MIIGVTGGIGSGKSTVSEILRKEGFPVYDTDKEARRLQNEHPEIRTRLMELFGNDAYDETGLNRKFLAANVFKQPELLEKLNAVVHPFVKEDFIEWMKKYPGEKVYFIESAILFEANFNEIVDKIILVTAAEGVRIERVMKRDSMTEEQVRARINNQSSDEKKIDLADFVIRTDDDQDLKKKLKKILTQI